MKLLRIQLRNYRGVIDAEARFEPRGVTIVEGPNEVGKSSIAEALGVLFDHLDSTSKREVKALKPVHRDEGAEIEVEVETGPYAFTYSKRFHKRPETRLAISRPKPENLTGREAHERAAALLAETIDVALWKALRIEQGQQIAGPELAGQTRLSAALDAAAGSARSGEREESLLAAARAEFERYFTPTGQDGKELRDRQKELDDQQKVRDESEAALRRLDADVKVSEQLQREVVELETKAPRLAEAAEKHRKAVEALGRLESDVRAADAEWAGATTQARVASDASDERRRLVHETATKRKERDDQRASFELADPERARAEGELRDAEGADEQARAAVYESAGHLELRRKDREFRREELDLATMKERAKRVAWARREISAAERTLAGTAIGDRHVEEIEKAVIKLEQAREGLEIGSPRVTVTARAPIEACVDGAVVALRSGEPLDRVVDGALTIELPGVAEVKVVAGSGASGLRAAFEKAREDLDARLREVQQPDLAAARTARDERREASRIVSEKRILIEENLRDLTEEQLCAKVESLETRVEVYASERAAEPPMPSDYDEAKRSEADAAREQARCAGEKERTSQALARRREASTNRAVADAGERMRADIQESAVAEAEAKLTRVRAELDDEALAQQSRDALSAATAKRQALDEAKRRLAAADPDGARTLQQNAQRAAEGARAELEHKRGELHTTTGRLQVAGEQGLAERRDAAAAACAHLELDVARTRARAAAARGLYDALVAAKQEAQTSYVAPLREQVERLGRLVFGPTLQVELDESLAIASRTVDGVTVPFESLSGGAREQLALLMRLACAILVAKEGGAPVVIDDALGYTDAERLETMGAALARAGESCQVIVLTCVPDRYRGVGGAKRVRLSAGRS